MLPPRLKALLRRSTDEKRNLERDFPLDGATEEEEEEREGEVEEKERGEGAFTVFPSLVRWNGWIGEGL